MRAWQLQDAKNKLSQVLREAATHGPQLITSHGREAAIVLSPADYHALVRPASSLVDFFRSSPLVGVPLELERDPEHAEVLDL